MPRGVPRNKAGYLPATKMVLMLRSRSFFIALYFCEKMVLGAYRAFPQCAAGCRRAAGEDHVTFRRAELAGFLHSDAARFFAFQQPLDFSCSE